MIEKLERHIREEDGVKISCPPDNAHIIHKINELVDAVNELQTKVNKMAPNINFAQPEVKENMQDKFAEQRRWIGKICEFWDNDDTQQLSYGVLTKIDTESGFGVQYCCNDEYDYDNCHPVKPDDDIIYKGE